MRSIRKGAGGAEHQESKEADGEVSGKERSRKSSIRTNNVENYQKREEDGGA
jgi:hypothetical protein